MQREEWADAADVRPGDKLLTAHGRHAQVAKVTESIQVREVFNLSVENIHTFYVQAGDTSLLVHNCGGSNPLHSSKCACATGGKTYNKTGPKPAGTGPHNQTAERVAAAVSDGTPVRGFGTPRPEAVIETRGDHKGSRRPDILVERPDGSRYGINIGKQTKRGAPYKCEQEALDDLRGAGLEMYYEPYN